MAEGKPSHRSGQRASGGKPKGDAEPGPPPFYTATVPLMHGGEGAVPVAAYAAGDRVPAHVLAEHPQWGPLVEVPDQYAGAAPPPAAEDDRGAAAPDSNQAAAGGGSDQEE